MNIKERFVRLSWLLLEAKSIYYLRPQYKGLTDTEYDALETEYKSLAESLGLEPSVSNMVDFDTSRPSCKLVLAHLDKTKKLTSALLSDKIDTGGNKNE